MDQVPSLAAVCGVCLSLACGCRVTSVCTHMNCAPLVTHLACGLHVTGLVFMGES